MKDITETRSSGFTEALELVAQRAASGVVARARLRSTSARVSLLDRLSQPAGLGESFLADPVFEAARVWKRAERTIGQMAGNELREELVAALDAAPTRRWQREPTPERPLVAPFLHQAQAWASAGQGRNFMVTSGTGSGKTECFMVPMLNDLLEHSAKGRIRGVQAIILYPLNALIESQKERLGEWMAPFEGRLSYALYNRYMEEDLQRLKWPGGAQVPDRKRLRENPASVLVTNTTMLEYLLMRAQDQPILAQSQGKLRWIVLDEAHSYVGAQAAEMALLLRRVRQAFGVAPEDVRLVATSATIGEGSKTRDALRRFVADLGGVDPSQVDIIEGTEEEPMLPPLGVEAPLDTLQGDGKMLWSQVSAEPRLRALRHEMRNGGLSLSRAVEILGRNKASAEDRAATVRTLEIVAQAEDPVSKLLFAPWRLHAFHRALGGLHACVDPQCRHRDPELLQEDSDWPYGQIWTDARQRCACGAPVFELSGCGECGTSWMRAQCRAEGAGEYLRGIEDNDADDEYRLDREPDDDQVVTNSGQTVLVSVGAGPHFLRLKDAAILSEADPETRCIPVHLIEDVAERGCCDRAAQASLIPYRFGAPFLMGNAMPTLLQALPAGSALNGPSQGRRLLSFTDSRQGTARFSAKLQQDAERSLTRAVIYHAVQASGAGDPERAKELTRTIREMEPLVANLPILAEQIGKLKQELAAAEGGLKSVEWFRMESILSQNPELMEFAGAVWQGRANGGKELAEDPILLARLFLLRELFRRPRIQNNVETMGMARLVFVELTTAATKRVPDELAEAGHDAGVWEDLLHAAVDIIFRANLAVDLPSAPVDMRHWISPKSTIGSIIEPGTAPDQRPAGRSNQPFPTSASDRSSLIKLICHLIKADLELEMDRSRVDEVLSVIWSTLVGSKIIAKSGPTTWRLHLNKAHIAPVERAWHCPETGRLLPFAPAGLSMNAINHSRKAQMVQMPRLPVASPVGLSEAERTQIRDWLRDDAQIAELRLRGIWSDLHDRVAEFSPFLRAQEHSAQIDRASLQIYENAFRKGQINILNCSTTMEMGVDIPDVGMVVNTNVPPAPANYRQRVGRAGRRGEPWAMAFTFCKDTPLDRAVFHQPHVILKAEVQAPQVRFDSAVLVQRHVNSLLLGIYLRDGGGTSLKTTIGTFFGATEDPAEPIQDRSMAENFRLALQGDWVSSNQVTEGLDLLTRGTALEGVYGVTNRCLVMFEEMTNRWCSEYSQLLAAQAAAPEADAAHRFYKMRAKRMRSDFMMTELARLGFTPAYGFPVDVISFDHVGADSTSGGPSRPMEMAIRDYSPGTETVIDGLVHRSEGIRPSWGNRLDPGAVEDLRNLWTCRSCNAFGTARTQPQTCPVCGAIPSFSEILRPAGFLGTKKPHSAYERLEYVAPDPSRARADGGAWVSLLNPDLGRHRVDRQGRILNTVSGSHGFGYAVCISCGRAEAEIEAEGNSLPPGMKDHFPLQAIRTPDGQRAAGQCPGNDQGSRRIRRNVRLGSETGTDVYELQLESIPSTSAGRGIALSLAAALREALAERLGVDAEEMGLSVAPSLRADGGKRMSIFLHDKKTGGAGLAVSAEPILPQLLERSAQILDCRSGCTNGCPDCTLRHDMQFELSKFDRGGALNLLSKDILPHLALPENLQIFGLATTAVTEDLPNYLARQINAGRLHCLSVILPNDPSTWDLQDWSGLAGFTRASGQGCQTRIFIPEGSIAKLDLSQRLDLLRVSARAEAEIVDCRGFDHPAGARVLAQIETKEGVYHLATTSPDAARLDRHWGEVAVSPILLGRGTAMVAGTVVDPAVLAAVHGGNAFKFGIRKELDGPAGRFGHKFWKLLVEQCPSAFKLDRSLIQVSYHDRYLVTPLSVRLLSEFLQQAPGVKPETRFSLVIGRTDGDPRDCTSFIHNWRDDEERCDVIEAIIPGIDIDLRQRRECPHQRFFRLEYSDGKVIEITLDQGFGAWTLVLKSLRFDGQALPNRQAAMLKAAQLDISMQHGARYESPVIVEVCNDAF